MFTHLLLLAAALQLPAVPYADDLTEGDEKPMTAPTVVVLDRDLSIVLRGDTTLERKAAAERLGRSGDLRAIDTLVLVLDRDVDAAVRAEAAGALGRIGSPVAAEALRKAAESDSDATVRAEAARAYAAVTGGTLDTAAEPDQGKQDPQGPQAYPSEGEPARIVEVPVETRVYEDYYPYPSYTYYPYYSYYPYRTYSSYPYFSLFFGSRHHGGQHGSRHSGLHTGHRGSGDGIHSGRGRSSLHGTTFRSHSERLRGHDLHGGRHSRQGVRGSEGTGRRSAIRGSFGGRTLSRSATGSRSTRGASRSVSRGGPSGSIGRSQTRHGSTGTTRQSLSQRGSSGSIGRSVTRHRSTGTIRRSVSRGGSSSVSPRRSSSARSTPTRRSFSPRSSATRSSGTSRRSSPTRSSRSTSTFRRSPSRSSTRSFSRSRGGFRGGSRGGRGGRR